MLLPHTTRITNLTPFFFFRFILGHTFSSPFVFFISLLSLFSYTHTHAHTSSHFVFFQVSTPLSLWRCVSHIACLNQYPHFNKVNSMSYSFLLAVRLRLMAHQESRPTSTPPFEAAFSSLCWSVTLQFSSRIKT